MRIGAKAADREFIDNRRPPIYIVLTLTYGGAVYWMRNPPVWRRLAASALVVIGLYGEYRQAPVSSHPYLTADTEAGAVIDDLEWREIPAGVLPSVASLPLVAKIDLPAGTPLTPSVLGEVAAPKGWLSLVIELPALTAPGTRLMLLADQISDPIDAVVLATAHDDIGYGAPTGIVSVAPENAIAVARADATGSLTVLMLPG
ncbi:MAG: hypothetical protein HKO76_02765 [Acidimicrobiia bacterium]|nr:hypothetical protein [Acidimicrobiia bacterium]